MKKYITGFIHGGLLSCGLGPIILAVIYLILQMLGVVETVSVERISTEILTVTLLAFVAGGLNIIYKIDSLPLIVAIFIHGAVLYLDYLVIYSLNGWISIGLKGYISFTVCFAVGFAVIWAIIYIATKKDTDRLNERLAQRHKDNRDQ